MYIWLHMDPMIGPVPSQRIHTQGLMFVFSPPGSKEARIRFVAMGAANSLTDCVCFELLTGMMMRENYVLAPKQRVALERIVSLGDESVLKSKFDRRSSYCSVSEGL